MGRGLQEALRHPRDARVVVGDDDSATRVRGVAYEVWQA